MEAHLLHSALMRCDFRVPCGRSTVPIRRASVSIPRRLPLRRGVAARHPPAMLPSPRHFRFLRRGGILRVRYSASCPADYSCRRTQSPSPHPSPPSSMRVLGECSDASVPRRAAVLRPSPRLGQVARRGGRHCQA
jgi:hypothetical protein